MRHRQWSPDLPATNGIQRHTTLPNRPGPCYAARDSPVAKKRAAPHEPHQGRKPGRRTRRRRDDPDHLALHQGKADRALPRHRPALLRPVYPEPRRHRGPGDRRCGAEDQGSGCRREMRHDHPRRGPGRGIRSEEDVALAQRDDPQHPRRRGVPRADHLPQRAAPGPRLDQADRDRPPRLRRPVPRHRHQVPRARQAVDEVRGRRRRGHRARGLRRPVLGRVHVDVQPRQLDHRLRPRLDELRPEPRLACLPVDQEHHTQTV